MKSHCTCPPHFDGRHWPWCDLTKSSGDYDGPPGVPHYPDPTEVNDGYQGRVEAMSPATVPDGDPRVDILAEWRATGPWSSTTVREAERRQARDILAKLDAASGVIS